jgi:hypothetical protein
MTAAQQDASALMALHIMKVLRQGFFYCFLISRIISPDSHGSLNAFKASAQLQGEFLR